MTAKKIQTKRPVVLAILDGWGIAKPNAGNAALLADTPHLDKWFSLYPHSTLQSHGQSVGLLSSTIGNSEVGHINLGAGYIVPQDEVRINVSIDNGTFYANSILIEACQRAKTGTGVFHILSMVGPGEVHGRMDHLWAVLEMARRQGISEVLVHLFSDGRDAPPTWLGKNAEAVENKIQSYGAKVASLTGRYWAMDRNNKWDRTARAYNLLTARKGKHAATLTGAVKMAYDDDKTDEFIEPTTIANGRSISDGDVVLFTNFRTDRPRQLTEAFVEARFNKFDRPTYLSKLSFYTMTEYQKDLAVDGVLFAPINVAQPLAWVVSQAGRRQLHISETEKYAHITFFINGGREEPFPGEDRVLIESPQVATYDLQPAMSSKELTDSIIAAVKKEVYDLIVVNYPNPDMVGHSGNLPATIEAIEAVDACLGRLADAVLDTDGAMVITSDHGNAETMLTPDRQIDTQHHANRVPLLVIGDDLPGRLDDGVLANVTPTVLELLGLEPPAAMTAKSLWKT